MRTTVLTALVTAFITLLAGTAHAQVLGYGVAGPAGAMGFVNGRGFTFNAAGGGEVFLGKYFTVGGEGGLFDRLVVGSANAAVHVGGERSSSRRSLGEVGPFFTAGYSRM